MNIKQALQQTFATNFVAYYQTHSAHINIEGRNFVSDHKLLGKIYEDLQEQIDIIGELIRTCYDKVPTTIEDVVDGSDIPDNKITGSANKLLETIYETIEELLEVYIDLNQIADEEGEVQIANYAQDRILALKKHCWMLRATIGEEEDNDD